ncbi:transglycosylase SLT domain-containing protein [Cellulomonas endophytica]|uniref:transglycosylase SLT domain-containing protein n=1 Tax=Cellulomonas endophytica TaxID=2494735 RepID=UPI0010130EC5|nr:transglycosylase SLT domain-containing protein [Cellulomonas endophytica]
MIKSTLAALGALCVPVLAVLTALSVGTTATACLTTAASGSYLTDTAPVPAHARAWVAATKAACPDLPEAWIAAIMAQESGFRPDAHAEDRNGGTWGLFQLNASVWAGAYGHPWSADLNRNGTWDVKDGDLHATTAGTYLCDRLDGVRRIRQQHPDWAAASIPELDALIIAHNAGESRLRTYPTIPAITARFIVTVNERTAQWAAPTGDQVEPQDLPAPTPTPSPPAPTPSSGCVPGLGTSGPGVPVPVGAPDEVTRAVQTALSYVGATSGWAGLCDRLACRAWGYATSGYPTAATHWATMRADGHAHPANPCPPLGSFVFFDTGRPAGHVSVVVHADPGCDPAKTQVTTNEFYDHATGNHGGVYLVTLAQLDTLYSRTGTGYLGWSTPVCAGQRLP